MGGDTNDMFYSSNVALDAAKNYPDKGDYMNNAATWDDFAEDVSQFVKNWVDFSSNSGSGGGGSGGSTPTTTTKAGCRSNQWQCASGQCIQANYKCDGSKDNENASWGPDCSDGSDENLQMCCDAKSSYSKKCPGQTTTTTTTTTTTKAASGSCTN